MKSHHNLPKTHSSTIRLTSALTITSKVMDKSVMLRLIMRRFEISFLIVLYIAITVITAMFPINAVTIVRMRKVTAVTV